MKVPEMWSTVLVLVLVLQVYCEMGLNGSGYTFINLQYIGLC